MATLSLDLDGDVAARIGEASVKLGTDPRELVIGILKKWISENKWLTTSVDEILKEYENTLYGYAVKTKKAKLRAVKAFLDWCKNEHLEPSEDSLERYLHTISANYSQSYINHVRSTLKEFVMWYSNT
uniref:Core-binding (CB) domain-containing protein n=1 Tax=Ignisphaera aggregans TaxID=334771 RepID=A0A7C2VH10_9CREN